MPAGVAVIINESDALPRTGEYAVREVVDGHDADARTAGLRIRCSDARGGEPSLTGERHPMFEAGERPARFTPYWCCSPHVTRVEFGAQGWCADHG
jgi:hypothetical protein